MADTDSTTDVETPSEDSPIGSQMGDGLFEDVGQTPAVSDSADTSTEAPTDGGGHSGDAQPTTFDPSSIDFQRVDLTSVPENVRPIVASAQQAIRTAQSNFTTQQEQLRQQLQQLEQVRQQPDVATTVAETIKGINKEDQFSNLTPEQRQAIDTVNSLISESTQSFVTKEDLEQVNSTIRQIAQLHVQQQQSELASELSEARTAYGADLENFAGPIAALVKTANPVTGRRYTIKQAYELASGKAQQNAQDLHVMSNGVNTQAKHQVGSVHSPSVDISQGAGGLSEVDALAGLKNLGFE